MDFGRVSISPDPLVWLENIDQKIWIKDESEAALSALLFYITLLCEVY